MEKHARIVHLWGREWKGMMKGIVSSTPTAHSIALMCEQGVYNTPYVGGLPYHHTSKTPALPQSTWSRITSW